MTIQFFAAAFAALLSATAYAQQEPVRIGFLTVRTGPLAAGGRQMEEGINLLLNEPNYAFAARKGDIIFPDTAGGPRIAKKQTPEGAQPGTGPRLTRPPGSLHTPPGPQRYP